MRILCVFLCAGWVRMTAKKLFYPHIWKKCGYFEVLLPFVTQEDVFDGDLQGKLGIYGKDGDCRPKRLMPDDICCFY